MLYCIEDFYDEYEKLRKNNSYKEIKQQVIENFLDKDMEALKSDTRLNNSDDFPYIKKRIGGRGGFRVYYLVVVRDSNVYLMFVHPKTGKFGSSNITDEAKKLLFKKVIACIEQDDVFEVTLCRETDELIFEKVQQQTKYRQ